jgi:hypothetical protein
MLAGEQIVPIAKSYLFKSETRAASTSSEHVEIDAGRDRDDGLKP